MKNYRVRVVIYLSVNGSGGHYYTMAWAVYDTKTGGVVLTDNFGANHFRKPSTWELIARELDAVRRLSIAGHELEPLWGHVEGYPWS